MKTIISILVLYLIQQCFANAIEIHKWVDDKGNTHYGENISKKSNIVDLKPVNLTKPIDIPNNTDPKLKDKTEIPKQKYKSFYKNKKTKYSYKTSGGIRLNPTYEYYNNGDLKQKWVYKKNLLNVPLKLDKVITLHKVSIIKEHRDSLTFSVSYDYHKNNRSLIKKPWLYISFIPRDYFSTKAILLKPGKHTIEHTRTLSSKAPLKFDTINVKIKYHESKTNKWSILGDIEFIKIWNKNI